MSLTTFILAAVTSFLLTYDVWTAVVRGASTTISTDIHDLAGKFLVIPFLFGALMAHFFWCVS